MRKAAYARAPARSELFRAAEQVAGGCCASDVSAATHVGACSVVNASAERAGFFGARRVRPCLSPRVSARTQVSALRRTSAIAAVRICGSLWRMARRRRADEGADIAGAETALRRPPMCFGRRAHAVGCRADDVHRGEPLEFVEPSATASPRAERGRFCGGLNRAL